MQQGIIRDYCTKLLNVPERWKNTDVDFTHFDVVVCSACKCPLKLVRELDLTNISSLQLPMILSMQAMQKLYEAGGDELVTKARKTRVQHGQINIQFLVHENIRLDMSDTLPDKDETTIIELVYNPKTWEWE